MDELMDPKPDQEILRRRQEESEAIWDLALRFPEIEPVVQEDIEYYGEMFPNLILSDVVRWMSNNAEVNQDVCRGILRWMEEMVETGSEAIATMVVVSGVEMLPSPDEVGADLRRWLGPVLRKYDGWSR